MDHPLCVDCASKLRKESESQMRDIESEIAEYSAALEHLEKGDDNAAISAELQKEIEQVVLLQFVTHMTHAWISGGQEQLNYDECINMKCLCVIEHP